MNKELLSTKNQLSSSRVRLSLHKAQSLLNIKKIFLNKLAISLIEKKLERIYLELRIKN